MGNLNFDFNFNSSFKNLSVNFVYKVDSDVLIRPII